MMRCRNFEECVGALDVMAMKRIDFERSITLEAAGCDNEMEFSDSLDKSNQAELSLWTVSAVSHYSLRKDRYKKIHK